MAMIAGQQFRPRDPDRQVQPAVPTPDHSLQIPLTDIENVRPLDGVRKPKAASRSIPIGRAPPRLA
jgi:hypothetical protein